MKPKKQQTQKNNLTQLDQAIAEFRGKGERVDLIWFSPIHIRIHFDFGTIDFWPSTGSWYEPESPLKGKGVKEMMDHAIGMLSQPKNQRWYSRRVQSEPSINTEGVDDNPKSPPW
jgi:hypothetical protein